MTNYLIVHTRNNEVEAAFIAHDQHRAIEKGFEYACRSRFFEGVDKEDIDIIKQNFRVSGNVESMPPRRDRLTVKRLLEI